MPCGKVTVNTRHLSRVVGGGFTKPKKESMHIYNGSFTGNDARLKIVPVLAGIALLIGVGAASAQTRRPSEDALNSLSPSRTLGRVGSEGRAYTSKRGDV